MAILWPQVYDYVRGMLPTLSGWSQVAVFDGPPDTGDSPSDYATVGYVNDDTAGNFQLDHTSDFVVTETGTVRVDVTCQTGDDDLSIVRLKVFGLVNALDAWLRADQSLGGVLGDVSSVLLASDNISSVNNDRGIACSVVCSLSYTAETPFPS